MFNLDLDINNFLQSSPFLYMDSGEKSSPSFSLNYYTDLYTTDLSGLDVTFDEDNYLISIDLLDSSLKPIYIEFNNKTYTRQSNSQFKDSLNSGEFIFKGSVVYLTPYANDLTKLLNGNISLSVKSLKSNIFRTNEINNIPKLFKTNNIYGQISIGHSFQDYPYANMTLITNEYGIAAVRNTFAKANNKFILYNCPYRPSGYEENISATISSDVTIYRVNIRLVSYYQDLLNRIYPLSLDNTPNINGSKSYNNPKIINFSINTFLQSKLGISLIGVNLVKKIREDEYRSYSDSGGSLINSAISNTMYYLDYSDTSGIRAINWMNGGNVHNLTDDLIWNTQQEGLTVSTNVSGLIEVPPTQVDLTDVPKKDNKPPEFKYTPNKPQSITVPNDITLVTECPNNVKYIRDLSLNFDQSGQTKEYQEITQEAGLPIRSRVVKYGFAYTYDDCNKDRFNRIYQYAPDKWQIISDTITDYVYDQDTGYLIEENISGYRLSRFKTESEDAYESVAIPSNNPADNLNNIIISKLYKFHKIPVVGKKCYLLKPYRSVYKDLKFDKNKYIFWNETLSNGDVKVRYKLNPAYVEPMFIYQMSEYYNSFESTPNPDNFGKNADQLSNPGEWQPDLTAGEEKLIETVISINPSKNTYITNDVDAYDLLDIEDSYTVYTRTFTAQDGGFNSSMAISEFSSNSGRPNSAQIKPSSWSLDGENNPINNETYSDNTNNPKTTKTVIYTSPYTDFRTISSSMQIDAPDMNTAIQILNAKLQRDKTFNETSLSVTTFFNPNIKPGDTVTIYWNNELYQCRVKSVQHGIDIVDKHTFKGNTQLSLGIISNAKYNVTEITTSDPTNSNNGEYNDEVMADILDPVDTDKTLGSMSPILDLGNNSTSRGNYGQ